MTYAEYLKSLGAGEDEIKVLDTPIGRRAFEKQQADHAAAVAEADSIRQAKENYEQQVDTWYNTESSKNKTLQNQLIVAEGNAARMRAAILAGQRAGLYDVAKDLGFDEKELQPQVAPQAGAPPATHGAFDPEKYTNEVLLPLANKEGRAIAKMAMLQNEHARLGLPPDVDWVAMYDESLGGKRSIEQIWMDRYKVADVRTAKAKEAHDAEVAKWKAEGAAAKEAELVSMYGNPNTRPLVPSTSPFTARKGDGELRAKQPWEYNDSKLSNDRVDRATRKLVETQFKQ